MRNAGVRARLRSIWSDINATYWFLPSVFSLAALGLALFTVWLDRTGQTSWLGTLAAVEIARPEGARSILTVIAGAMIAVAATIFSITIAAVAYASGSYGPRLLTNFMEDKGNQLSLATFIGTFVYSIMVLRTIRGEDETPAGNVARDALPGFVPQLSVLIAYLLMALSVVVLIYFLNHVPSSIRANTVLQGIGERLIRDIRHSFPHPAREHEERQQQPAGHPVAAMKTGYIQVIDYPRLHRLTQRESGRLALAVRTGDFVHPGMTLAYWTDDEGRGRKVDEALRNSFALGGSRTPDQDLHFLLDELVEIGLRALSAATNDPFTAIAALHWIGAATAELAGRDLTPSFGDADSVEDDRLILLDSNFAHYVARGFGTIRYGVAGSPPAAIVMFDTLHNAAAMLDRGSRRDLLTREGDLLMQQARLKLRGPDLDAVEERYVTFQERMQL